LQFLTEALAFFYRKALKFLIALFQALALLRWHLLPFLPALA
jgi:hypothetical protein